VRAGALAEDADRNSGGLETSDLERETRLELATPTMARSGSNSEYERTGKRSRDAYFPAGSMLFDAELAAVEVKPRRPVGGRVRAHSCVPT
jgi:hypothetical protein